MRALQEAVAVCAPYIFAGAANDRVPVTLVLVPATTSAEMTLNSSGWYTFKNISSANTCNIGFYSVSVGAGAPVASANDWTLMPGERFDHYVDFPPTIATNPETAFRFFKAFSTTGASLQWYKSS